MNHLCDLKGVATELVDLSEDDARALEMFRKAYNDCKPGACPSSAGTATPPLTPEPPTPEKAAKDGNNNSDTDSTRSKEDDDDDDDSNEDNENDNNNQESTTAMPSSPSPPPATTGEQRPEFLVDSNDLPPCGWRPLDDVTLYRFLCADRCNGKFQEELSLDRLRRAMANRKKYKCDDVFRKTVELAATTTSPANNNNNNNNNNRVKSETTTSMSTIMEGLDRYQKLRVRVFTGVDNNGTPVMFERLGEFLGSGNSKHFSEEEWIKFYMWDMERHFIAMRNAAQNKGANVSTYVYCGDLSRAFSGIMNGNVRKVIPLLKALIKAVEDYYPEIAERIILFNMPSIGTALFKIAKGFMDPITASKIVVFSSVPIKEFKKFMPLEAIPKEYGGANTTTPYPKTEYK